MAFSRRAREEDTVATSAGDYRCCRRGEDRRGTVSSASEVHAASEVRGPTDGQQSEQGKNVDVCEEQARPRIFVRSLSAERD